jgi:uncharacterized membrane protein
MLPGPAMTDPASTSVRSRLDAVDLVRGIVMIVMLLDHTRDFSHASGLLFDPLDPNRTTPLLYLTRWITHLCAPTFVMLAGLSVGLKRLRGSPPHEIAHVLWTRGLWLVFLEVTIFRVLIWFNVDFSFLAQLQVIWAIGISMIVLAALVRLPIGAIAAIGVVIVLGHNALDGVRVLPWRPGSPVPSITAKLWMVAHQGGFFPLAGFPGPIVWSNYPVLPWFGIIALGYALSQVYAWTAERRRRTLIYAALVMMAAFFVVRGLNVYGDPRPWTPQGDAIKTAMSFFNVAKYPPSLSFTLITLAPALLALGLLDGRTFNRGLSGAAVTFGRVPFFFYFLQWPTAHFGGMLVSAMLGKSLAPYFMHLLQIISQPTIPNWGGPLWAVYVLWISGVLLLYFPCRWFAQVKARRHDWWLSYL